MEFLISGILCGLVILLSFIIYKRKIKRNSNIIRDEIYRKEKEKIVVQVQKELDVLYDKKSQIEHEISEKLSFNNSLLKIREDELERLIEEKKKEKLQLLDEQANNYYSEQINFKDNLLKKFQEINEEEKQRARQELEKIVLELDDWQGRRNAINEDIRRAESLKNEQTVHRIILTEDEKSDIELLLKLTQTFHKPLTLYKLIWSEYLIKHFNEMIALQFGEKIPNNVIYCIENINTHKKYIGKTTTEVSKRWTEHIKTSLKIGTVSRTKIHDELFGHWDEFTFSIIEIIDKNSSLSDKEKWYVNFYQSNIYGYNMKSGG
jgi:hypothetical protein